MNKRQAVFYLEITIKPNKERIISPDKQHFLTIQLAKKLSQAPIIKHDKKNNF
jgi:hypothetical protein